MKYPSHVLEKEKALVQIWLLLGLLCIAGLLPQSNLQHSVCQWKLIIYATALWELNVLKDLT